MSDTHSDDAFTLHLSKRAKRVLVSLFLVFHCTAMMTAPFPINRLRNYIYPPFEAYLHLLYMENYWAFFAPGPLFGRVVSYRLETVDGRTITAPITARIDKRDPNFFRLSGIFDKTSKAYPDYVRSYALHICALSKKLSPKRVQFLSREPKLITEALYRVGRRPSEDDFGKVVELDWIDCSGKMP